MTWRFDPSKGLEPLGGIPLEADDKAFDAAVKAYEDAEGDPQAKGSVKLSGIYKHTDDKAVEKEG